MLVGEHVGLRAITKADLPHLLEWRNRPEYRQYFREYRELSAEQQQQWFETMVLPDPKKSGTCMFAIEELATKRLLGACGLCYLDWVNQSADFSIYIGADDLYIDDKFAPDAARLMLRYAFDELSLHRVWTEIYEIDTAKQQLFKTIGLRLEGTHLETHWTGGRWVNSLFYGMLESEYRSLETGNKAYAVSSHHHGAGRK